MSFDYSKLSDADLEALAKEDYKSMSTEGLQYINSYEEPKKEAALKEEKPGLLSRAGEAVMDYAITPAVGAIETAYSAAPVATAAGGAALASAASRLPGLSAIAPAVSKVTGAFVPEVVKNVAGGVVDYGKTALDIAHNYNLNQAEHQMMQYLKTGKTPDPAFVDRLNNLRADAAARDLAKKEAEKKAAEATAKRAAMASKFMPALETLGQVSVLPSALSLPYMGAAYEQEKIRANPVAPEYATNPYAQMTRGEYQTQGQAGAANRRQAIADQQYGGLTAHEQELLHKDHKRRADRLQTLIQEAAAKKALVDPTMAR